MRGETGGVMGELSELGETGEVTGELGEGGIEVSESKQHS